MSVGHWWLASQHGQLSPDVPIVISVLAACDFAKLADAGRAARLAATNSAIMRRSVRINVRMCRNGSLVNSQRRA